MFDILVKNRSKQRNIEKLLYVWSVVINQH